MTDPITPIRGAVASEAYQSINPVPAQAAPAQPDALAAEAARSNAPDQSGKGVQPQGDAARLKAPAAARPSPASQPATEALPYVHFRFKVDPTTHDVTVIMFDATAHKVLRTIPAKELQHLSQGELLSLWA